MNEQTFQLKANSEFITLGQLIKVLGFVDSGGNVKYFLETEKIFVNDTIEKRRGKKLFNKDIVKINEHVIYVVAE